MNAQLLDITGDPIDIAPASRKGFTLDELYKLLDCELVEVIHLSQGRYMIVDEEGKIKDKPENILATEIYQKEKGPYDYIVGKAIICPSKMFK